MNDSIENNNLFKRENPFKVPDNYFENLSDRIFEKILLEENKPLKPVYVFNWKRSLSLAAAIVGITFISYTGYKYINRPTITEVQIAQISDTTDPEFSFVDENLIVEALTTTGAELEVEGDDIISFLVDDDLDENLIAEAY